MKFKSEKIADVLEEAKPLLLKHWEEIAHYKDIPFDPDYDQYIKLEELGTTRSFSARTEDGVLIGYAVFFVRPHIHYRSTLMAYQDIIFLDKAHRGIGFFFIKFCDDSLRSEGIKVVLQHIKAKFNWGPMIERMGYELQDLIYTKRLDK